MECHQDLMSQADKYSCNLVIFQGISPGILHHRDAVSRGVVDSSRDSLHSGGGGQAWDESATERNGTIGFFSCCTDFLQFLLIQRFLPPQKCIWCF